MHRGVPRTGSVRGDEEHETVYEWDEELFAQERRRRSSQRYRGGKGKGMRKKVVGINDENTVCFIGFPQFHYIYPERKALKNSISGRFSALKRGLCSL